MKSNFSVSTIIRHSLIILLMTWAQPALSQTKEPAEDASSPVIRRIRQLRSLSEKGNDSASREVISIALSDPNWYVKGEAIRALARTGDSSTAQTILPLLNDDNWYVRGAAIEALSRLGQTRPHSDLVKALQSNDPYTRARAATSLAGYKSSEAVDALVQALDDKDDLVKRNALLALGTIKAASVSDRILALLKAEEETVRRAAAVALGLIGEKKAVESIIGADKDSGENRWEVAAALGSEYFDIRFRALQTLAETGNPLALPPMMSLAGSEKGEQSLMVRLVVAESVGRFEGEGGLDALNLLIEDLDPRVRAAAVASYNSAGRAGMTPAQEKRLLSTFSDLLRKERSPQVISALEAVFSAFDKKVAADVLLASRQQGEKPNTNLIKILAAIEVTTANLVATLKSGPPPDRALAAERLGLLGDLEAVPPLMDALSSGSDTTIKVNAARSLGRLRDRRAVDALISAAGSGEADVKVAALESLGAIADHNSTDALFAATTDEDPAVRDAAIKSLAALGISVDRLSSDAASPNWQVRVATLTTLARLGDRRGVPIAAAALKDPDPRVRAESAKTLSKLGDTAGTEPLIGALSDPSADVRVQTTLALGMLKDARALGPLTSLLNDRDPRVSLAAAESLARLQDPRARKVLVSSLSNPDWRVRARAAQVLARVSDEGIDDQTLRPLASTLSDKDPVVRFYAAEALVSSGGKAAPHLLGLLGGERESERDRAMRILVRIGPPAVDSLLAIVQDRSRPVETRAMAAQALGQIGDPRAVKAVASLLKDERLGVRRNAALALSQMGEPAVEDLLQAASSSDPATREIILEALGRVQSTRAIERVVEALGDSSGPVRSSAVRALGETSSERAVQPLLAILRDETSTLRSQAAASLGRLGTVALPSLIGALRDSRPSVRSMAAEAIGEIGSKEAVGPLVELIRSDTSGARGEAILALGKIGDPSAVDAILSALKSGSPAVRKSAVTSLSKIRGPRSVDALVSALSDRNEEVRQLAATGLGEMADQQVVQRLEQVADDDPSADVRSAAARSIEQIRSRAQSRRGADKK
jgi:HEAT repeat protein